jgi:hypothetical protein
MVSAQCREAPLDIAFEGELTRRTFCNFTQVIWPLAVRLCDFPSRLTDLIQDQTIGCGGFLKNFADGGDGCDGPVS